MTPWLSIIGIGAEGWAGLTPPARALIESAEILVGGSRHLALIPAQPGERLVWRQPLSDSIAEIAERRGRRVTVLATGDPMCFGIGATLARGFALDEMTIIPAPSAFSLARARLGWSCADVEAFTLHGRPLDHLNLHVAPGVRLLILSEDGKTPAKVAAALTDIGYGPSEITVLSRMGAVDEDIQRGLAATWDRPGTPDLNTIAVACRTEAGTPVYARVPGLPDDAYRHDGLLTKRSVRAATLAALGPLPGTHLWDVGAGAGSIAIEWMRAARGATADAIEQRPARIAAIAHNANRLGVPDLGIVTGVAPEALQDLAPPDAIFIGGGLRAPGLVESCWERLNKGGRLVANAVTVAGEGILAERQAVYGGSLTRIAVSHAAPIGNQLIWRPLAPVTQWAVNKS